MAVTDDDDQGGGGFFYDDDSEEVTGGEGGYLEKVTEGDMGGGGVQHRLKNSDVINECSPMTVIQKYRLFILWKLIIFDDF